MVTAHNDGRCARALIVLLGDRASLRQDRCAVQPHQGCLYFWATEVSYAYIMISSYTNNPPISAHCGLPVAKAVGDVLSVQLEELVIGEVASAG